MAGQFPACNTEAARSVQCLSARLIDEYQAIFLQSVRSKGAFKAACKDAGIENFRFHDFDFRHTAITNLRRAGVDMLTIVQISGHKTMVCFIRYNSFREADLIAAAQKSNTYFNTSPCEGFGTRPRTRQN